MVLTLQVTTRCTLRNTQVLQLGATYCVDLHYCSDNNLLINFIACMHAGLTLWYYQTLYYLWSDSSAPTHTQREYTYLVQTANSTQTRFCVWEARWFTLSAFSPSHSRALCGSNTSGTCCQNLRLPAILSSYIPFAANSKQLKRSRWNQPPAENCTDIIFDQIIFSSVLAGAFEEIFFLLMQWRFPVSPSI